jgi:hypothetical protein
VADDGSLKMDLSLLLENNLRDYAKRVDGNIAAGTTRAADRLAVIGKLAMRDDIRQAQLGDRLANTWQATRYPKGKASASPAVFLYSKAPKIVRAFTTGATIKHHDGLWLAIPTENVPNVGKGRGRRKASPVEVEAIFNQDLIVRPGRGRQLLAFVDAVRAKSGKGFRRATSARTGKQNRKAELVLMFILVPQVTLRKRLNWPRVADKLGLQFPGLIGEEIAMKLS